MTRPTVVAELRPEWAWLPYEPGRDRPWNRVMAGHLHRRAGFGATWSELERSVALGPQLAVDRLLNPEKDVAEFERTHDEYESSVSGSSLAELAAWWLQRMLQTPHPLREKLTLFWHHQFATSGAGLDDARLMAGHLQTLRQHALGTLPELFAALPRDPAVVLWLRGEANRKARPNEPFARQLLELLLGPNVASPVDVREAARALTGLFVLRHEWRFFEREHDSAQKVLFGQKGNWGIDDVARLAWAQSAAPHRVVRDLYAWLISEADGPNEELLAPLVETFARDGDVAGLVATMLRSNVFFSPFALGRRIKTPVEFLLGLVRPFEAAVPAARLAQELTALGQTLLEPPTPAGWPRGMAWLNSASLTARLNLASALLAESGRFSGKLDPLALARRHGHDTYPRAAAWLGELLLQERVTAAADQAEHAPPAPPEADSGRLRRVVSRLAASPEFQLA